MNMRYCSVCGVEFNAQRVTHTCAPHDLELVFREEQDQPVACNLNGDDLKAIKREIEDNGNPPDLVRMWERSAGRPYAA